jgi:hypothetical protein
MPSNFDQRRTINQKPALLNTPQKFANPQKKTGAIPVLFIFLKIAQYFAGMFLYELRLKTFGNRNIAVETEMCGEKTAV